MNYPETSPWHWATIESRTYLTPEDIQCAINAGAEQETLVRAVFFAIEGYLVEDWSECMFVASKFEKSEVSGA